MIIAGNFKTNHTRSSALAYCRELDLFLEDQNKKKFKNKEGLIDHSSFIAKQSINDDHQDEVYIFAPSASLPYGEFSYFKIGAQNAYPAINGAFTGEIGLEQLQELKVQALMIGHSERRVMFGEDYAFCKAKFDFFAKQGMEIFFCVGENLAIRQENKVKEFLQKQLADIDLSYSGLIVAYEPIWAIGTGVSAELEEIERTCEILKGFGCSRVLYGGSVNAKNARGIMRLDSVDGVLVGGACLDLGSFCEMIQNVKGAKN